MPDRQPVRLKPFGPKTWRLYDRDGRYIVLHDAELRQLGHRLIQDANAIDGHHISRIRKGTTE